MLGIDIVRFKNIKRNHDNSEAEFFRELLRKRDRGKQNIRESLAYAHKLCMKSTCKGWDYWR